MTSIIDSAEAWFNKYAELVGGEGKQLTEATTEEDQQARINSFCDKAVSFFLPKPIGFGSSPPSQWESHEAGKQMLGGFIKRYIQLGIGFGADVDNKKIILLYDYGTHGACLIDVHYLVKPLQRSGLEPYVMHAHYGYRRLPTGEEGFEFVYMDDEFAQLQKRVPNFFEGMGPPQ